MSRYMTVAPHLVQGVQTGGGVCGALTGYACEVGVALTLPINAVPVVWEREEWRGGGERERVSGVGGGVVARRGNK